MQRLALDLAVGVDVEHLGAYLGEAQVLPRGEVAQREPRHALCARAHEGRARAREREREGEREEGNEGERERGEERERKWEWERESESERGRDRERDRSRDRERDRERQSRTVIHEVLCVERTTERQAGFQTVSRCEGIEEVRTRVVCIPPGRSSRVRGERWKR